MKIVQTLYTANFNKQTNNPLQNHNQFYWYCWIHSCMSFVEKGHKVELVTDDYGKKILVDMIGLPYTQVNNCLDSINYKLKKLWSLAKIKAFSVQSEPFIHFDHDAFYYEKSLPSFNKPGFAQWILEKDSRQNPSEEMMINFVKLPLRNVPSQFYSFHDKITQNISFKTVNAGSIGANDVDLMNKFSTSVLNFAEENVDVLIPHILEKGERYKNKFLCLLEEQMFYEFFHEKYGDEGIQTALGTYRIPSNIFTKNVEKVSKETGYVHMMHRGKSGEDGRAVRFRENFIQKTKQKYPEYCELVDIYLNN
jgi:hypothetical protein